VAQIEAYSSRTDTATVLTVDEIAALFGIPVAAVRERLARRVVQLEYFSIPDLAKRWRCSRGTVYNRLRAYGAQVLDFAPNGKRGKKVVAASTVLQLEARQTKRLC
jgi:transposase